MASAVFSCQDCSMHFSGPVPYMDHLKSARHQKKVATQRHLQTLTEGGMNAAEPALDTHLSGAHATASAAVLAQSALLPFVCKLCNVAMNCQEALDSHNRGKKHLKALQREEVLRKITLEDGMRTLSLSAPAPSHSTVDTLSLSASAPSQSTMSPMAPAAQPQMDQRMEDEDVDLSCHYCGIVLFKSIEYKLEHLETDAHYNKKHQGIGRPGVTPQQQPNVARIAAINKSP